MMWILLFLFQRNYPSPMLSTTEPTEDSIATLVSMGFDRNSARQALVHARNDVTAATNILLEAQAHWTCTLWRWTWNVLIEWKCNLNPGWQKFRGPKLMMCFQNCMRGIYRSQGFCALFIFVFGFFFLVGISLGMYSPSTKTVGGCRIIDIISEACTCGWKKARDVQ